MKFVVHLCAIAVLASLATGCCHSQSCYDPCGLACHDRGPGLFESCISKWRNKRSCLRQGCGNNYGAAGGCGCGCDAGMMTGFMDDGFQSAGFHDGGQFMGSPGCGCDQAMAPMHQLAPTPHSGCSSCGQTHPMQYPQYPSQVPSSSVPMYDEQPGNAPPPAPPSDVSQYPLFVPGVVQPAGNLEKQPMSGSVQPVQWVPAKLQ